MSPRNYIPEPPLTENLDTYINRQEQLLDNLQKFSSKYGKDLIVIQAVMAQLELARQTRDRLKVDYIRKLPDDLEGLKKLRDETRDEIELIEKYKQEVEQAFIPEPRGIDGSYSEVPSGFILFNDSDMLSLKEYLNSVENAISFLEAP